MKKKIKQTNKLKLKGQNPQKEKDEFLQSIIKNPSLIFFLSLIEKGRENGKNKIYFKRK